MIELKDVKKEYSKGVAALNGINLKVEQGEFVFIVGDSGSGKSTLIKLIMKELDPTSGSIVVNGQNLNKMRHRKIPMYRRAIGVVFQDFRLLKDRNIYENIAFAQRVTETPSRIIKKKVPAALSLVGLAQKYKSFPKELSGGEQQRVAIARAYAVNPEVLLMDEPFGAVDPLNRANLQNEFLKIQKQLKKTVIFVTHDIDEAMKMGDKIAIMSKGILRNFASPEDTLLSDDEFVKSFLGSETYIKILSRFRVKEHMRPQNGADIPYHADCEANLRDVLAQMIEYGTDSMHVTEKGKITGTILLSDILNLFQKGRKGE